MNENLDIRVGDRYRLLRKLGSGALGVVYEAIDLETDQNVAIKLELRSLRPLSASDFGTLQELSGGAGIPRVYADSEDGEYLFVVLELLGPSLQDLLTFCDGQFSLKTVLMLADQLISRLQYLHRKGIVHRDLKPDNLLMGLGRSGNVVYLIDYSVAMQSSPPQSDLHSRKRQTIGSEGFVSASGHVAWGACRCDDLESLGYVFLYFIRGTLPWWNMKGEDHTQTAEMLFKEKTSISVEDLCAGLPKVFATYFNHIRSHRTDDKPNYSYLRKIFLQQFLREGFKHDSVYDWTIRRFLQLTNPTTSPQQPSSASAEQSPSLSEDPKKQKSPRRAGKGSREQIEKPNRLRLRKQPIKRAKKSGAKKQVSRQAS